MPTVVIRYNNTTSRISITPNETLTEAMSKFCAKKKLTASNYALKHRKYGLVSMTTPFRLNRVDNNATLDLVPKPKSVAKPVRVAVQTPDRKRVQDTFPSTRTLFEILKAIDEKTGTKLTVSESANGVYLAPVVTLMASRRSLEGESLHTTSLASLGITGSTLLCVTLKERPGVSLADAKAQYKQPTLDKKESELSATVEERQAAPKPDESSSEGKNMAVDSDRVDAKVEQSAGEPATKKHKAVADSEVEGKTVKAQLTAASLTKAAMQLAASKRKSPLSIENVNQALEKLQKEAEGPEEVMVALQTIRHIISKLIKSKSEKFRALNLNASKLQAKLGRFRAGSQVLESLGFLKSRREDGIYHVLLNDREDQAFLKKSLEIVSEEILLNEPIPEKKSREATGSEGVSAVLENQPESFDWEDKKDREKKKKEEEKRKEELKRQTNLLERSNVPIEEMHFDWEKEKKEEGEESVLRLQPRTDLAEPEYNLSDVRRALEKLQAECKDPKLCAQTMVLLRKITEKLQVVPKKPQYRKLKLSSSVIQKKVASKRGAMDYLAFLGFEEQQDCLILPPEKELDVKTSRALSVLNRIYKEIEPEISLFDSEQRKFQVFDGEKINEASYAILPQSKVKTDSQLVMESMREAKLRKALEGKILERQRLKRRYDRTIIRIVIRPEGTVLQGYFHPNECMLHVFKMIRDSLVDPRAHGEDFRVKEPPSKEISFVKDGGKTLDELELVPAATLNCFLKDAKNNSVLKAEILSQKKDLQAERIPRPINEAEIEKAIQELIGSDPRKQRTATKKPKKKEPKWMRMQRELGEE